MRKLSQINEGVMTNTLRRFHTGDERKQDIFRTNINEMKEVNLGSKFPVYFANINLEINGNDKFTWSEIEPILDKIEINGWRLPIGLDEINDLFLKSLYPHRWKNELDIEWKSCEYGIVKSKETEEVLLFTTDKKYGDNYWCNWGKYDENKGGNTARGFYMGDPNYNYGCLIVGANHEKTSNCKIRLIKDK